MEAHSETCNATKGMEMKVIRTDCLSKLLSPDRLALLIYGLYAAGFIVGITAVVGAVIAHMNLRCQDEVWRTHFRRQVKVCWWSIGWLLLGGLTIKFGVGYLVLAAWFTWVCFQIGTGLYKLSKNLPA
ncbi:hypothetical protein I6U33_27015 [Pseudomonas carnis]|uniref:DUF4870 family protein n=1 Tax=Pseudomonas carnis TaxID=2487355 RepID=UPI001C6F8737|nr:hypothetical protein [Pseudomonas carnis]MBW9240984.1 hypothetical protein [Pseudomonas carnis]